VASHPPPAVGFWAEVVDRAENALAAGAMHSFECALEFVPDAGVEFVLRVATKLPRGETAAGRNAAAPALPADPFAAPEPQLVVRDRLTSTHRALLNKFSVLREHLLIATREFVDQRAPLDERDFAALTVCMEDAEVLAFYNGGMEAGASQAHKHLQVVTLPLSPRHAVPMDALFAHGARGLPFRHAYARLAAGQVSDPAAMRRAYEALHRAAGLRFPQPYNLLVTHEWMLVVPRARDKFEGVSVNSLGFAGSFFLRDAARAHLVAAARPMAVLKSVARP
jgi:sulfate adenylyltransferase (ADP) / ATP adenylyltransferase